MASLDDLLLKTSRTFALAIPLLPEPTRREVTVAYLLFRIADTFEDSHSWSVERRIAALQDFTGLLGARDEEAARRLSRSWSRDRPIDHEGYQELLRDVPHVLEAYWELPDAARETVREHVVRTNEGMASFVARARDTGRLDLEDLADLRRYCYVVAGIVGEMLTELFLLDAGLAEHAVPLRERARAFGEGLQLVNILKDTASDVTEGRSFMPSGAPRSRVFEMARADLVRAAEYVRTLQRAGAPRGLVAFTALPALLARATLDRVERDGPGAKVTRPEVFAILERMDRALDEGRPAIGVHDPAAAGADGGGARE